MGIMLSSLGSCLLHKAQQLLLQMIMIPSSNTPPAYLPSDVVFDILSRVPVKSLCRFKCVSREWRALIADPVFVAARKSRPAEPLLVVSSRHEPYLRLVDMDGSLVKVMSDQVSAWTPMYASLDDVLCLAGHYKAIAHIHTARLININTGTTSHALLRAPDNAWGYGRAVPSGAYKMVRFGDHLCEVVTIGGVDNDDGWRRRQWRPIRTDYARPVNYTAAVNGMLHFLPVALPDDESSLQCFDLEREEWKSRIKGPPNLQLGQLDISLCKLNGAVCLVEPENGRTNIWLLTDQDKSSWVKAYTLPLDPSTYCQMMPLTVLPNSRKLLFYCITKVGEPPALHIYDPYCGTCTDVTRKLVGDHVSSIGICSLHLEDFILADKIQGTQLFF